VYLVALFPPKTRLKGAKYARNMRKRLFVGKKYTIRSKKDIESRIISKNPMIA
jgi:hypothetical protein